MSKIITIAEICCNHMGSLEYAKKMIDTLNSVSADKKVNVIKFQKRTPKLCLSEEKYNSSHPDIKNAFGNTYGEHREFLEFNIEQHKLLKKYVEDKGFLYSCSIFDKKALNEMLSLKPELIKVGSANNIDYELLTILDNEFQGEEIHISLGMTTKDEEKDIIKCFKNQFGKLVLYACTSSYPTESKDICLLELKRLKQEYGNYVKGIGFSGHHQGIYHDIAALTLGATYFERHFTLDKNNKGTDQKISLEIDEFSELIFALNQVSEGLSYKNQDILPCEKDIRNNLKFRNN